MAKKKQNFIISQDMMEGIIDTVQSEPLDTYTIELSFDKNGVCDGFCIEGTLEQPYRYAHGKLK